MQQLQAGLVDLIESRFERRVHLAKPVDDLLGAVEVLALALRGPVVGRTRDDVAKVTNLVCELHQLGSR
jgi:hypothetical protein